LSAKKKLLEELIEPVIEGLGYECWGIEYVSQGKHSVLRVYIESAQTSDDQQDVEPTEVDENITEEQAKESGIELKDCELVSRQISGVLDVEDPINGEYTLEVSSPGMDRPLYKLDHYDRFKGSQVNMRLRMAYEGRRKYSGLLKGLEGNDVVLQVGEEEFLFPIEAIEKANVVPQFD
jgi:ribosome maturation factor RimP